jgi:hypothetical protein
MGCQDHGRLWQAKYIIASRSVHTDNCPELLHYFHVQEHQQGIIDGKHKVLWAKAQAQWKKARHF